MTALRRATPRASVTPMGDDGVTSPPFSATWATIGAEADDAACLTRFASTRGLTQVFLVVWGLSRGSDVAHDREGAQDWFTRTERILQAVHFWTADQAKEQVHRARGEWEHAQSRRTPGTEELDPGDVFGTPEEYAASLSRRPTTSTDPIASGRWYYLTTGILLGAWATFRTVSQPMNWLTLVIFLFSVTALVVFVWASLRQRRSR